MVHLPFIAMFTLLEKCTGWQLSGSFRHKIHKHIPTTFKTPRLRIPHLIPLIWISEEKNTDLVLFQGYRPPTPIFLFFPKQTAKKKTMTSPRSPEASQGPTPKCQEAVVSTSMRFSICSAVSSPPSMARKFGGGFSPTHLKNMRTSNWTSSPNRGETTKIVSAPTSFWWKRKTNPL